MTPMKRAVRPFMLCIPVSYYLRAAESNRKGIAYVVNQFSLYHGLLMFLDGCNLVQIAGPEPRFQLARERTGLQCYKLHEWLTSTIYVHPQPARPLPAHPETGSLFQTTGRQPRHRLAFLHNLLLCIRYTIETYKVRAFIVSPSIINTSFSRGYNDKGGADPCHLNWSNFGKCQTSLHNKCRALFFVLGQLIKNGGR